MKRREANERSGWRKGMANHRTWSRPLRALGTCTRGATATTYIIVLGCVALVGLVAFGQLSKEVESAAKAEALLVASANGAESEGPTGSLYAEAAAAGLGQALVEAPWALAGKGAHRAASAAYRKKRGHTDSEFDDKKSAAKDPSHHDGNDNPKNGNDNPKNGNDNPKNGNDNPKNGNDNPKNGNDGPLAQNDKPGTPNGNPEGAPACRGPGCKSSCFVAGTPVLTPDGFKPIELINVGDEVLSRDESNGVLLIERVEAVNITPNMPVVGVEIEADDDSGSEWILATPGHFFWTVDKYWTRADELAAGDDLLDAEQVPNRVLDVRPLGNADFVYSIGVPNHSHFVGELAVWARNPRKMQKRLPHASE